MARYFIRIVFVLIAGMAFHSAASAQDDVGLCMDRCYNDFATCLTPAEVGEGQVPTPPPYEFCFLVHSQCVSTCQAIVVDAKPFSLKLKTPIRTALCGPGQCCSEFVNEGGPTQCTSCSDCPK